MKENPSKITYIKIGGAFNTHKIEFFTNINKYFYI